MTVSLFLNAINAYMNFYFHHQMSDEAEDRDANKLEMNEEKPKHETIGEKIPEVPRGGYE